LELKDQPRVIQDVWHIIENDKYMWCPVWGDARAGKTTLCLLIMFHVYQDWDLVLDAIVFNLSSLMYKMRKGIPKLFPTLTKPVHNRIPILLIDDFAAQCGKAKTQHEKSWDLFKGAFDTLGTRLACLLASMVDPSSPTQQLMFKFTHELMVQFGPNGSRVYKYDRCTKQQDFRGWQSRHKKTWLEEQEFGKVPLDVFTQYDEMRTSLVSEVFVAIEDSMVEDSIEKLKKRVQPIDIQLIRLIKRFGPVYYHKIVKSLGDEGKECLIRCKARSLITPLRQGSSYYKYDVTDLGLRLIQAVEVSDNSQVSTKIY